MSGQRRRRASANCNTCSNKEKYGNRDNKQMHKGNFKLERVRLRLRVAAHSAEETAAEADKAEEERGK